METNFGEETKPYEIDWIICSGKSIGLTGSYASNLGFVASFTLAWKGVEFGRWPRIGGLFGGKELLGDLGGGSWEFGSAGLGLGCCETNMELVL